MQKGGSAYMDQAKEESQLETTQNKPKIPPLPPWPTSKPGPMVTEPPPGQIRMPLRTDQVVEIGYDQERGVPGVSSAERSMPDQTLKDRTSFDQLQTAQEVSEQ